MMERIVIDTNVLVAGLRSRSGASFRFLSLVGTGRFEIVVSVPLVLEYEAVLLRHIDALTLTEEDVGTLMDYLCSVARAQEIFYLWRPELPDVGDDFVLEVAVNAGAKVVVTFNIRDFVGAERFGLTVLTPADYLRRIGEIL